MIPKYYNLFHFHKKIKIKLQCEINRKITKRYNESGKK